MCRCVSGLSKLDLRLDEANRAAKPSKSCSLSALLSILEMFMLRRMTSTVRVYVLFVSLTSLYRKPIETQDASLPFQDKGQSRLNGNRELIASKKREGRGRRPSRMRHMAGQVANIMGQRQVFVAINKKRSERAKQGHFFYVLALRAQNSRLTLAFTRLNEGKWITWNTRRGQL